MTLVARGVVWITCYLFLVTVPLVIAGLGNQPARDFVTEFSVALGFIGLAAMGLQFVLVARFQSVAAPFGQDALVLFHRQISYVALLLILAHPILLFFTDTDMLELLNPLTAPWRARFALVALVGLILLIALSVWRKKLNLSYEVWQASHAILAVIVVATALTHVFLVGYYVDEPWKQGLWLTYSAAFVILLAWVRIVRPIRLANHPWRLKEVLPERDETTTVVLEPEGHDGLHFKPGQFGWITVRQSPFAISPHPFSFSSSAEQTDVLKMSIKAVGDFTNTVSTLEPGTKVYLDGPYGVFTPDRAEGPGFVLIGGGIGITPLMSILRTFADRGDVRPVILLFGNSDWDEITFREELEELQQQMNLTVVHVLSDPNDEWEGESGYIDEELVRRHLPDHYERYRFFVVGPAPMMDTMEEVLPKLGIPSENIRTERFDFV
jgi:predicted ferric reductase